MTYAEQCDHDVFNWDAFLNKPEFTDKELKDAYDLANQWVTCACGNLCADIPRSGTGCPEDDVLEEQGRAFNQAISCMLEEYQDYALSVLEGMPSDADLTRFESSRQWAKETLLIIENRAAQILNPP